MFKAFKVFHLIKKLEEAFVILYIFWVKDLDEIYLQILFHMYVLIYISYFIIFYGLSSNMTQLRIYWKRIINRYLIEFKEKDSGSIWQNKSKNKNIVKIVLINRSRSVHLLSFPNNQVKNSLRFTLILLSTKLE